MPEGPPLTMPRERPVRPKFDIVKYQPEHKAALLKLQRQHWGSDDARNAAYFKWKYEVPSGLHPDIYVAMQGRDIVGMCGFWETMWTAGPAGKTIPMVAAGDMVVTKEYRGLGLFEKIAKFGEADLGSQGYRFLINLSAAPVTHIRSVRLGWRNVGAYRSLRLQSTKPNRAAALQTMIRNTPLLWRYEGLTQTRNPFRHFDKIAGRAFGGKAGITIGKMPDPSAMVRIVQATDQGRKIALQRDQQYFSWRYLNPKHDYRFLYANNGSSEGYMVLETRKGMVGRHVNIIDWEAADSDTKKALLEIAIEAVRADSLSVWSTPGGVNDHPFLFDAGFREVDLSRGIKRYKPSVLIKPIGDAAKDIEQEFGGLDPMDQTIWNLQMTLSDNH